MKRYRQEWCSSPSVLSSGSRGGFPERQPTLPCLEERHPACPEVLTGGRNREPYPRRTADRSSTASEKGGHASSAQGPNSRSAIAAAPIPATGSTHRNAPDPPKCPNVSGEFLAPVQCGRLSSRISKVSPHGFGSNRPTSGRTPASFANCGRVASPSVFCATSVGERSSRPKDIRSPTLLQTSCAGEPRSSVCCIASGWSTPARRYSPNDIPVRVARYSANTSTPVFE